MPTADYQYFSSNEQIFKLRVYGVNKLRIADGITCIGITFRLMVYRWSPVNGRLNRPLPLGCQRFRSTAPATHRKR